MNMRSYPTKSPAATCTLGAGFQIEWHPDAPAVEEENGDAGSVCSSCSCSDSACGSRHGGSTYSLATSVSYHPTGDGEEEQNTLLASNSREIIVGCTAPPASNSIVGPTLPPSRAATSVLHKLCNCCNAFNRAKWLLAAFGLMLCELVPWIVGFTLIIYFYRILGVGPGMGILLIMVVLHGLLRFLKAHGDLDCYKKKSKKKHIAFARVPQIPQNTSDIENPSTSPGPEESGPDQQQPHYSREVISEVLIHPQELPPSYELAVIKPPPYDLNSHLTPNKDEYSKVQYMKYSKEPSPSNMCGSSNMPSQVISTEDYSTHDDLFLPSYQDVIENLKDHNPGHSELTQNTLVTDL